MQEQYDPRVEKRDEEVLDKQCSNNVVEEGKAYRGNFSSLLSFKEILNLRSLVSP